MISEVVKICGLPLDEIEKRLFPLRGFGIKFDVKESCLDASITMSADNPSTLFESVKSKVYASFEDEVYSAFDISLQALAARLLKMHHRTLAVAESLTGGSICSMLTQVPGISENFYEGIVCYNRISKMTRLGVGRDILACCGAVSRETAIEMVRGLIKSPVDVGISTTGLAGPDGDEGKPVGLVYIGVGGGEFVTAFERKLSGTRNEIRQAAANLALFYLVRYLKGDILRL